MERIQGVVLEIEGRQAVVLTPEGDFREVEVRRSDWEVGETINVPVREPIMLHERSAAVESTQTAGGPLGGFARGMLPTAATAVAAVLVVAMLVLNPLGLGAQQEVYAVVTVDLHETFRLYVNSEQQVLDVSGGQETEPILAELRSKGTLPLGEAVSFLVRRSLAEGQLRGQQAVVFGAALLEEREPPVGLEQSLDEASVQSRNILAARAVNMPVVVLDVADSIVQQRAAEVGLSLNQYVLLLQARANGLELSLEQVRRGELPTQKSYLQQPLSPTALSDDYHALLVEEVLLGSARESRKGTTVEVSPEPPAQNSIGQEGAGAASGEREQLLNSWLQSFWPPGLER